MVNVKCVKVKFKRRWGLLFSLYPGTSRFNFDLPLTFALPVVNGGCNRHTGINRG